MKKTILILSLFLGMLNSTFAQGNEMSLTIEEAKQYAINHNRSLQNASLDAQIAEANRWQIIATMLPQLKASFDYTNMCGYEMKIMNVALHQTLLKHTCPFSQWNLPLHCLRRI